MKAEPQKQNQQQASSRIAQASAKPRAIIVHPIMRLQRTIGNHAVERFLRATAEGLEAGSDTAATTHLAQNVNRIPAYSRAPAGPQAKLSVNTPGDIYEQEADAMADAVMRTPGSQSSPFENDQSRSRPVSDSLSRTVQTASEGVPAVSTALSDDITSSQGNGSTMDGSTHAFMESRFGMDFSHVRIHNDAKAAHMARELNAHAFTVGTDIYFDSGKYLPHTDSGKHLLAHELTHTIQQGYSQAVRTQTEPCQGVQGLGVDAKEDMEDVALAQKHGGAIQSKAIQRSTKWDATGTVHEAVNLAVMILKSGDSPITWHMLNGSKLETDAIAEGAITLPTLTTSGSGADWKAKVDTVPEQKGTFDETVLSAGPWSTVGTKVEAGAVTGLAACTGAGNSTFSAKGKPSDDAVYKANRKHENHHAADHKVAFDDSIGAWDKKVQDAKTKGTEFKGATADAAKTALWTAVGGTPQKVAKDYRASGFAKGGAYHGTPSGGPMATSTPASNADCSTSSVEVTNPA